MTGLVGLIGYPLGHSLSPVFQQAALDYYELKFKYELWPTTSDELPSLVSRIREFGYLGANVTIPHKVEIMALLDEIDDVAKTIGAVNTIVKKDEKLIGYNTDAFGFLKPLLELAKFKPSGARVLLLGAGGAARSACYALLNAGVTHLVLANRTLSNAERLACESQKFLENAKSAQINFVTLADPKLNTYARSADLIVNATSIGMRHSSFAQESLLMPQQISEDTLVYDLVYNPRETQLLRNAKDAGARTLEGIPMLVYQGAESFELWFKKKAPIDVMMHACDGEEFK